MADGISGAEHEAPRARPLQQFGTIVVVGGGCYGSYYVRQLGRAAAAGAAHWTSLVVVDRDPGCRVASLPEPERPVGLKVVVASWDEFFQRYLDAGGARPGAVVDDAIVPSPLMPHLMADWLV
ncbi:MAG: hypothetical protein ABJA80_17665, partial [bacterium]